MLDKLLQEKQIQPCGGKKEGSILFVGGSPGTGKNWVVNNLTDIKNRYKVFDIDDVKSLLSLTRSKRLEKSLIDYVMNRNDIGDDIKIEIIDGINNYGFWSQLVSRNHKHDVIHEFLVDSGLFSNKIKKFFMSIGNVLPNIAFNATMQNIGYAEKLLDVLKEIGYDVDKTDVLWVVAPKQRVDADIEARNNVRKTDMSYVLSSRNRVMNNMLDILQQKNKLGNHVCAMYIVINDRNAITYYDDTQIVKDFRYYKVDVKDKKQVRNAMRKILRERYV